MSEKDFQNMVVGLFQAKGAHVVNMEPAITNPGIPDINWCMDGIEGNVELKFGHADGAAPMIRPMQLVWFRERIRAGGYPMLGYYIECKKYLDEVYVYQGRYIEDLAKAKTVDEISDIPTLRIINPKEMIEGLISEMASWHDELHPRIALIN